MAHKMNLCFLLLVVVAAIPSMSIAAKISIEKLDSEEDVAVALAKYTAQLSEKFIKEKGSFSVVLAGGTLVETMRKLSMPPYNGTVNWSKWLIFWVDERVVPLNDPLSNYKLAYDGFLSKVPIPKNNIFPLNDKTPSPEAAAVDYESRLKTLVDKKIIPLSATGFPKFDLILLGIGPDGHIASLFPNRTQRYEKKRWVTFITDSPNPPPSRITFTFPVINSATDIAMVVTAAEEADAVAATLGGSPPVPPLPCGEVKAEEELTWFLDKDAASKLH